MSRTTGDIEALTRFVDWGAYAWLVNTSIALTATVTMFVYSWQLAVVAVVMLVLMVPVLITLQREQQRRVLQVRERTGDLLSEANEAIAGAHAVRAFGQRRPTRDRLDEDIDELYTTQLFANRVTAVLFTVSDIFGTVAIGAVLLTAIWLGVDGPTLGTTIAVIFLVQMILVPIAELTGVIGQFVLALAGWERTIDLANRRRRSTPAIDWRVESGALDVAVTGVDFAYGEHQVLHDVSLSIPAGTAVAVVGATGSGKTTLARLLCRLADPSAGTVKLGGVVFETSATRTGEHRFGWCPGRLPVRNDRPRQRADGARRRHRCRPRRSRYRTGPRRMGRDLAQWARHDHRPNR